MATRYLFRFFRSAALAGLVALAACQNAVDRTLPTDAERTMQNEAGPEAQARELGRVGWSRDHEATFAAAREDGKPVLLLFQEIPG